MIESVSSILDRILPGLGIEVPKELLQGEELEAAEKAAWAEARRKGLNAHQTLPLLREVWERRVPARPKRPARY
jgi:hypothetical protein